MGAYVNPPNGTKEQWLKENALEIKNLKELRAQNFDDLCKNGQMLVVLVDNGPFAAAAIAYCRLEWQEFTRPDERRPRRYFIADVKDLLEVSDLVSYIG